MEIGIRGNGKYELEIFGRTFVVTRTQLDELHELIESVNRVESAERDYIIDKTKFRAMDNWERKGNIMNKFSQLLDSVCKAKTETERRVSIVDLEIYLEYSHKVNPSGKIQIESADDIKRRIDHRVGEWSL